MPGTTPPTSQLEWLSSTTAMIVLFGSRAMRDLLRACPGEGRGRSAGASRHSIGYMQRRSCHVFAARPIASVGLSHSMHRSPVLRKGEVLKVGQSALNHGLISAGPMVRIRFAPAVSPYLQWTPRAERFRRPWSTGSARLNQCQGVTSRLSCGLRSEILRDDHRPILQFSYL